MPLLDHFRPPLAPSRSWESFHSLWSAAIVECLNRELLPEGYFAETQVHIGGRVEVDVATLESPKRGSASEENGNVATETWAPPETSLQMPSVFPDEIEVQVFRESGGANLVAAIELVSPANKDRPETRLAFATKCASYLHMGIGLLVVDLVTERQSNLHHELLELLRQPSQFDFDEPAPIYSAAYRPRRDSEAGDIIDIWLERLTIGESLPTMPLALRGAETLPIDLETTYTEARSRSRLD